MAEEFRAIRPEEMDECLDLWDAVFVRVGKAYFVPYFEGDPWFKPDYTRVCAVDGKLVSAVQVCERRVRIGAAELVMGGIGNVGTHSEFRSRGYSSHLLRDCVRVMGENRMDFSVLFTGIHDFYGRIGWRPVPVKLPVGKLKVELPEVETPFSVRRADWSSDLESIKQVYEAFNERRTLTTIRTPEYWSGYALPRLGSPLFTLAAEADGEIAGYLNFRFDEENCWLREIGYLPGEGECARALVRQAAAIAREKGAETLWCNLPHEPAVLAALRQDAKHVEIREPSGMMCRIIDMRTLGERLLPELNRRAHMAEIPAGSISLDTELGSLELRVDGGQVGLGAHDPIRISLTQTEFFSLLFGIKDVDELGPTMPEQARQILSALFPPQQSVFWLTDHF
jgi:predicted acetyltransferase